MGWFTSLNYLKQIKPNGLSVNRETANEFNSLGMETDSSVEC